MFRCLLPARVGLSVGLSGQRALSSSTVLLRTNTSTRTKENVTDLNTFLTLIGRGTVEHAEAFDNDLEKFLKTKGPEMKQMGIDVQARRYMLRWIHKFVNDLEPLREHKKGKKKNGGQRKEKEVLAKRRAAKRIEENERLKSQEQTDETVF